jgi:ankyrin repeat protein
LTNLLLDFNCSLLFTNTLPVQRLSASMGPRSQPEASCTTLSDLPINLQQQIFASAAAPLDTCKVNASIAQDASLTAAWLVGSRLTRLTSPFRTAAKHQLWDVCEQLLTNHHQNPDSYELAKALDKVACAGRTSLFSILLQRLRVHHKDRPRKMSELMTSALHSAASYGHASICSVLLQHPDISAGGVRRALGAAAENGHLEVMQLLMSSRPDTSSLESATSPMCRAAYGGHISAMQLLVQHGAGIHNNSGEPWSGEAHNCRWDGHPLEHAAGEGRYEAVKWLLQHSLTGDVLGEALKGAAGGGHLEVMRLLLEAGANVNEYGVPAFAFALENRQVHCIQMLLEAATDTGHATATGAAQPGSRSGMLESLQYHVQTQTHMQSAYLMQAAVKGGHTQFAELLQQVVLAILHSDPD